MKISKDHNLLKTMGVGSTSMNVGQHILESMMDRVVGTPVQDNIGDANIPKFFVDMIEARTGHSISEFGWYDLNKNKNVVWPNTGSYDPFIGHMMLDHNPYVEVVYTERMGIMDAAFCSWNDRIQVGYISFPMKDTHSLDGYYIRIG